MTTRALVVALFVAAACDRQEEHAAASYPQINTLFAVSGSTVTCDGPSTQEWSPAGGPYLTGFCEWTCVSYGTRDYQRARVDFTRASSAAEWGEAFGANVPGKCP
jgi:hypothetical protein